MTGLSFVTETEDQSLTKTKRDVFNHLWNFEGSLSAYAYGRSLFFNLASVPLVYSKTHSIDHPRYFG